MQQTPKTRSAKLSAAQSLRVGLYAHICTFECAAGSPTPAAAAAHEHCGTELALFSVCGAHKTQKNTKHCLRDHIIPWASMLISALLNMPLRAQRQQQQQSASTFALTWHFLRVAGRTRRKQHAGGHYLRDNLTTWASNAL